MYPEAYVYVSRDVSHKWIQECNQDTENEEKTTGYQLWLFAGAGLSQESSRPGAL